MFLALCDSEKTNFHSLSLIVSPFSFFSLAWHAVGLGTGSMNQDLIPSLVRSAVDWLCNPDNYTSGRSSDSLSIKGHGEVHEH